MNRNCLIRVNHILVRATLFCLLALAQTATIKVAHSAEAYPVRPITLVIPYGTKSDTHRYGEILAKYAKKHSSDINLVLENRVGDSGAKAASEVRLMKADGYTLILGRVGSQVIAPAVKPELPYRHGDFTMLGLIEIDPLICAVRADSPYKTHRDLTQAIRKAPGTLKFGHTGPGTTQNITTQYFMRLAGLKLGSEAESFLNLRSLTIPGGHHADTQTNCTADAPDDRRRLTQAHC